MLRVYKHYSFGALAHPALRSKATSFSSYPGEDPSLRTFMHRRQAWNKAGIEGECAEALALPLSAPQLSAAQPPSVDGLVVSRLRGGIASSLVSHCRPVYFVNAPACPTS